MSPSPMDVVARVERATRERPDGNALTPPDGQLSYEQLWSKALDLAGHLNEIGVGPGDPVASRQPARERWANYAEVAPRLLRGGPGALSPQDGFDYRGATEIACRYQLPGHEVPLHHFVSEGTAAVAEADLLGWNEFHKGALTVHRVGGDHVATLELPVVEQLARMMLESLRKARVSTRVERPVATLRGGGAR
jgi:hypothetical protein